MAARGRPKKPTKLKSWEGNPGRRKLAAEPEPEQKLAGPKRPTVAEVGEEGLNLWDSLVPRLAALELATEVDRPQLVGLCWWWGQWRTTTRQISKIKPAADDAGKTRYLAVCQAAVEWKRFEQIAAGFGLSPSARASLGKEIDEPDEFDRFSVVG